MASAATSTEAARNDSDGVDEMAPQRLFVVLCWQFGQGVAETGLVAEFPAGEVEHLAEHFLDDFVEELLGLCGAAERPERLFRARLEVYVVTALKRGKRKC